MLAGEIDKSVTNLNPPLGKQWRCASREPVHESFLSFNFKEMLHLFLPFSFVLLYCFTNSTGRHVTVAQVRHWLQVPALLCSN